MHNKNIKEIKDMIINNTSNIYFVSRNESIDRYLASIRDYKPLEFNEENMYITRYKIDGDLRARDMLVNCNQRFIYSAAKRLSNNPDTILELVNEGTIGLMEAIEKFDFTKGCRLLTFANHYIRRNMVTYYCENRLVKRPSDTKIGSLLSKERSIFFTMNERQPSNEELRSIMLNKYSIDIQCDDDLYIHNFVYVDDNVSDDDYTVGDTGEYLSATNSENDYVDKAEKEDTKAIVLAALGKIDKRTSEIIKMLYGIEYDREYSASEIAEMYGLTKTRVNQIRNEATKKLQYLISA